MARGNSHRNRGRTSARTKIKPAEGLRGHVRDGREWLDKQTVDHLVARGIERQRCQVDASIPLREQIEISAQLLAGVAGKIHAGLLAALRELFQECPSRHERRLPNSRSN